MADFNVRSDSVNVEQIMEQIRARIREKRGVDYTEQQIRELAAVKLEKFLDPRGVRSDLLEQFQQAQPRLRAARAAELRVRRRDALRVASRRRSAGMRKLLLPILKLFFNPEPADPGAAHPVAAEHDQRRARSTRDAARQRSTSCTTR